jgi:ADP-glucose pyrophosphorylase
VHSAAQVDPTATVSRSVIGHGAVVGAGANIADSVLLSGSVVEDAAMVANSVVMGQIGKGAVVSDAVVGLHGRIESGEHVSGEFRPPADST